MKQHNYAELLILPKFRVQIEPKSDFFYRALKGPEVGLRSGLSGPHVAWATMLRRFGLGALLTILSWP